MTQEEKQLLFKDLSARLLYGVICHASKINLDGELFFINKLYNIVALYNDKTVGKFDACSIIDVKPYLRSMSSMTEDEKKELHSILDKEIDRTLEKLKSGDCGIDEGKYHFNFDYELDFCLSHHFDHRGLIPMGLALEAPEGMYSIQ